MNSTKQNIAPRFREIAVVYLKAGAFSFGAGASEVLLAQIVEKKKWLSHEEYGKTIALATLMPGPFHVNLVIALGRALAGTSGSLIAVFSFVLPGFIAAIFTAHLLQYGALQIWLRAHAGVVTGIIAAVIGMLLSAIIRLGVRTLPHSGYWASVVTLAFFLYFFKIPFALAILGGGLIYVLFITSLRKAVL